MVSDGARRGAVDARVVETHSSVVFFVGDRVYKMKKPLDLGFSDFTTREARHEACHKEVELNSRLSPDAYLGVLDVIGTDAEPCEHLVMMRRMPDDRRMTQCVERGEDIDDALRTIARKLATLHDVRPPDSHHDRLATPAAVRARWLAGFEQLRGLDEVGLDQDRDERIESLVLRYIDGRADLFEHRIRRGRIRDGHGDLQAEDIFLLPEGPQVLDCIEFSEDYRWGDVLSDVAFLAMDLDHLGRPDLGDRFLTLHRELSADHWPPSLAHHYVAYRAMVRAKVGALRADQYGEQIDVDTESLFALAVRHLEQGRVRLALVGGPPGSGKSTLASRLGERLDAVVLRSDEVRTRGDMLAGYDTDGVRAVYDRLLGDARRLLRLGEHVILDATFGDPIMRELARQVARDTSSDLTELHCSAPVAVTRARVERRMVRGKDLSDATPDVATQLAAAFAPWPEAVVLDTTASVSDVVALAVSAIG